MQTWMIAAIAVIGLILIITVVIIAVKSSRLKRALKGQRFTFKDSDEVAKNSDGARKLWRVRDFLKQNWEMVLGTDNNPGMVLTCRFIPSKESTSSADIKKYKLKSNQRAFIITITMTGHRPKSIEYFNKYDLDKSRDGLIFIKSKLKGLPATIEKLLKK